MKSLSKGKEGYVREGIVDCSHPKRPLPMVAAKEHGIGCVWQCKCGAFFELKTGDQREPGLYWARYYPSTASERDE